MIPGQKNDTDMGRDGWFNCGVVVLAGAVVTVSGLVTAGIQLFS